MANNPPADWPKLSVALFYVYAAEAILWLEKAFGFETRLKIEGPDGKIVHSELVCGDGLIMVASAGEARPGLKCSSPREIGNAVTAGLYLFVDDVDAHYAHARAAGAEIVSEPDTQVYGDRTYSVRDCEGHWWTFGQRVDDEAYARASKEHGS